MISSTNTLAGKGLKLKFMQPLCTPFSPFTALAEVEDALLGDPLGDVLLGPQAGRTHVAGVGHDQSATLTAGSAKCSTQQTLINTWMTRPAYQVPLRRSKEDKDSRTLDNFKYK